MIPTMWLIIEGDSDQKVMRRILAEKGINIRINHIHPSGGGGIPRLAEELEDLLLGAMKLKKPGDCIIVLHDADELRPMGQKHRQHYAYIDETCRSAKFKDHVALIVAHDELEAWLLADEKLCKWLNVKPHSNCDSIAEPSKTLDELVRKHHPKMRWNGRYWDDVLKNIDASGDKLSASMREAIKALAKLPCIQRV